jgi:hypothetical protein
MKNGQRQGRWSEPHLATCDVFLWSYKAGGGGEWVEVDDKDDYI